MLAAGAEDLFLDEEEEPAGVGTLDTVGDGCDCVDPAGAVGSGGPGAVGVGVVGLGAVGVGVVGLGAVGLAAWQL